MIIQIDTREHEKAIENIIAYFDSVGIKHISSKMYVGDYQNLTNGTVAVDRKQNISEICSNVIQQHARFKAELIRAQEAGIKLFILIEHGKGFKKLEDVKKWINPQEAAWKKRCKKIIEEEKAKNPDVDFEKIKLPKPPTSGETLFKILNTQEQRYGIKYLFCEKNETGKIIAEILNGNFPT